MLVDNDRFSASNLLKNEYNLDGISNIFGFIQPIFY